MDNEVVASTLQQVSLYDTIMWMLFIFAIISGVVFATVKIYRFIEKYRDMRNTQDEYRDRINAHTQDIKDLKAGQTEMFLAIKEINNNVQAVTDKIDEMQQQKNEQDRASIKEKLLRLYYHCHDTMSMTQIEKDTIDSLIASYENAAGTNSFIHSLLIPEMYNWKLLP